MRSQALLCLTALALGSAACNTTAGDYPSLAVRDVERAEGKFEPVEPAKIDVPPVGVDLAGDLPTRLAALVADAQKAHAAFEAATPAAERSATGAAGAASGSDSWAAAQVALASLDSARSQVAIALGDLDMLAIAASVEGSDRSQIETARGTVIALVQAEDSVLERLRARVR